MMSGNLDWSTFRYRAERLRGTDLDTEEDTDAPGRAPLREQRPRPLLEFARVDNVFAGAVDGQVIVVGVVLVCRHPNTMETVQWGWIVGPRVRSDPRPPRFIREAAPRPCAASPVRAVARPSREVPRWSAEPPPPIMPGDARWEALQDMRARTFAGRARAHEARWRTRQDVPR
jgi:hypothetical protein